jgi:hypothetical protein
VVDRLGSVNLNGDGFGETSSVESAISQADRPKGDSIPFV